MAETQPASLHSVCAAIAAEHGLDEAKVLATAAKTVPVTHNAPPINMNMSNTNNSFGVPGPLSPMHKQAPGNSSFVSLSEVVDMPAGKTLNDMNVHELKELLAKAEAQSANDAEGKSVGEEGAVPFLLRYVLGEFHYGQRATRKLPGQQAASGSAQSTPANKPNDAGDVKPPETTGNGEPSDHQLVVAKAFDVLANEAKYRHLHQVAGWVDLDDKSIWDSYCADVIDGKICAGDTVFEAGCGVLAFLTSCLQMAQGMGGSIKLGGVDGARKTVELVQSDLLPNLLTHAGKDHPDAWTSAETALVEEARNNFYVGMLPDCLLPGKGGAVVADNSWDVVVCNSVFQYLASHEQAKQSVEEMIRIAKRWVIIADICDEKYDNMTQHRKSNLNWTGELPDYRTYKKSWWEEHFDNGVHLVSIKHVTTQHYARRTERYVVYIEKNACLPKDKK